MDCWDGTNGEPIIYHGLTLTTKIKLIDVVTVIKKNAFAETEYVINLFKCTVGLHGGGKISLLKKCHLLFFDVLVGRCVLILNV